MSEFGLPQRTLDKMRTIFAKHRKVKKIKIYGSRAMGNYREGSDIDLTMYGEELCFDDLSQIAGELDDSTIPYLIDLSIYHDIDHAKLKNHIQRHGKIFYDSYTDWKTVKLGEIVTFFRGLIYSKKDEVESDGLAVLRATNINLETRKITFDEIRYIRKPKKLKADKMVQKDDIIMCTASGSKSHLGKVALVTEDLGMAFGGFMAALRCNSSCYPKYLLYVLTSNSFLEKLSSISEGTNINNLKFSQIENFQFHLPPLAEQQRIVAKLDAVFAEIDDMIEVSKLKLAEASKTPSNLIKKILEDETYEWTSERLSSIAENLDSMRIPITKSKRTEGNIPYYGASGIVDYVRDYIFDEELLLISEDGANLLARTYPIAFSVDGKTWVNNHAHVLKFEDKLLQRWVEYYLNSTNIAELISGMAQPKLNQKKLNEIPIPCPKPNLISKLLSNLEKITTQSENLIELETQKTKQIEMLKSAILAQELQSEAA